MVDPTDLNKLREAVERISESPYLQRRIRELKMITERQRRLEVDRLRNRAENKVKAGESE